MKRDTKETIGRIVVSIVLIAIIFTTIILALS